MQVNKRENGLKMAREALARKKELMELIPDVTNVGTISDFMFKARLALFEPAPASPHLTSPLPHLKAGVQDILAELDRDLVGLKPVKTRVREIASLLVSAVSLSERGRLREVAGGCGRLREVAGGCCSPPP